MMIPPEFDDAMSAHMNQSLIPDEVIEALEKVFEHGAMKYAPHDWMRNITAQDCLGAVFGHLSNHIRGNKIDIDSGNMHIEHALCRLAMFYWLEVVKPEIDKENYFNEDGTTNDI